LCEKEPASRLLPLIERNLITEKTLLLTMIGRHFLKDNIWFVVSRDSKESKLIEKFETILKGEKGKPAVYMSGIKGMSEAKILQDAFSTGSSEERKKILQEIKI